MTQYSLRDYQKVAREFLIGRERAGLFLDMGLGKTAICLAALRPEDLPCLVVAPKKIAEEVWDVEVEKFRPDLSVAVAAGEPPKRKDAIYSGADIVVIGRDNIRDLLALKARPWKTLIFDELSGFKSRASMRWKIGRKLVVTPNVKNVWGLTGTPSPNGLIDLWAQIYLLDGGARLGKTIGGYRERYFIPGHVTSQGVITEWIPRAEAPAAIERLIEDICLSMETDGRVELPEVTFNTVTVELPPRARKAYIDFRDDLVTDITDIFGGEIHTAANSAILSSKLSQITAGFLYVDDADVREGQYTWIHTAKLDRLKEMLSDATSPVLVFYRFQAELKEIQKAIPRARHISEPGIVKEWNRGEVPIMLAHPASAGHGLNLQHGGHTCIWTSLPWSLEEWEQANKRLHRSGQTHPVVIHVLTAKRTVDQKVAAALIAKQAVQGRLLEFLESPV